MRLLEVVNMKLLGWLRREQRATTADLRKQVTETQRVATAHADEIKSVCSQTMAARAVTTPVLLVAIAFLAGCASLNSPAVKADEAKLSTDWAALKDAVPVDLFERTQAIANEIAMGNYAGAFISVIALTPELEASLPAVRMNLDLVIADFNRIVKDARLAQRAADAVAKSKPL